jgi:hypothetical protein
MGQSPSKANGRSNGKEISCRLWGRKIDYCVNNSPPIYPILSQMNPVHILILFLKIHFIIIEPHISGLSSAHFPSGFLINKF